MLCRVDAGYRVSQGRFSRYSAGGVLLKSHAVPSSLPNCRPGRSPAAVSGVRSLRAETSADIGPPRFDRYTLRAMRLALLSLLLLLACSPGCPAQGSAVPSGSIDRGNGYVVPGATWEPISAAAAGFSAARLDVLRAWLKTQPTTRCWPSTRERSSFEYGDTARAPNIASVRRAPGSEPLSAGVCERPRDVAGCKVLRNLQIAGHADHADEQIGRLKAVRLCGAGWRSEERRPRRTDRRCA